MLAWVLLGLFRAPLKFLGSFIPGNVPFWIKPLLTVVEIISFLIRPISLSVRLFANMMAGHILLHIILNVITYVLSFAPILFILPLIFILLGFFILEIGIAILQAYIFTVMLCIYLKEIMQATITTAPRIPRILHNLMLAIGALILILFFTGIDNVFCDSVDCEPKNAPENTTETSAVWTKKQKILAVCIGTALVIGVVAICCPTAGSVVVSTIKKPLVVVATFFFWF